MQYIVFEFKTMIQNPCHLSPFALLCCSVLSICDQTAYKWNKFCMLSLLKPTLERFTINANFLFSRKKLCRVYYKI